MARRIPRAKSYREQVDVFISSRLSPEARGPKFLAYAERHVDQLIAHGLATENYVRAINGTVGAPDNTATVPGRIVYSFDNLGVIVAFAIAHALTVSPFRSGRFKKGFMVALDGRVMAAATFKPADAAGVVQAILYNDEPYSRKADVQIGEGHRPIRFKVAAGLFEDTAAAVRDKYGNSVSAKRVYDINRPGGYVLRKGRDKGTKVQSPSVVITKR